jgi:hypothetical protein
MSKRLEAAKRASGAVDLRGAPIEPKPVLSVVSVLSEGGGLTPPPKTWTGRIVSLDDWRRLTEAEQHGSNGRLWNGMIRQWEQPE